MNESVRLRTREETQDWGRRLGSLLRAVASEHGIGIVHATGDVDLATDNGRLFARIKGAVARSEVERKSARQRAAGEQRRHCLRFHCPPSRLSPGA